MVILVLCGIAGMALRKNRVVLTFIFYPDVWKKITWTWTWILSQCRKESASYCAFLSNPIQKNKQYSEIQQSNSHWFISTNINEKQKWSKNDREFTACMLLVFYFSFAKKHYLEETTQFLSDWKCFKNMLTLYIFLAYLEKQ